MLIWEVLFSLYDRSQNYSERGVLNFGKEIKTILPTLLMEKDLSNISNISTWGVQGNKFIFHCETNGMFLPITKEEKSKWGQILFLLFWFNSLEHQIGQHICHFSTRFMLKSTYATRTTRTVFYTIETKHLPQNHASKS